MTILSSLGDAAPAEGVGAHLRAWRLRRRRSQLDLALDAGISQRHVSFVESGRAQPSRSMVMLLADELDVPLRERNALLLLAGYAPVYPEHALEAAPLAAVRHALDAILQGHSPNPALAVDGQWRMVAANAHVAPLLEGVRDAGLLKPPINVLRLSLSEGGLAPRIANLPQWRAHLLARLRRQAQASCDPALVALLAELEALAPVRGREPRGREPAPHDIVAPLELDSAAGRLSLISTTTVFGAPHDVTVSELAIETFFPADEATAQRLRRLAPAASAAL
ncbi:MAG TPA: helix-turn-helix transcriptional regulator [Roseiarcus sp.]|jgi:transcriptional regulator with XRE-family HTH domain